MTLQSAELFTLYEIRIKATINMYLLREDVPSSLTPYNQSITYTHIINKRAVRQENQY